jgi:hypothetical protein
MIGLKRVHVVSQRTSDFIPFSGSTDYNPFKTSIPDLVRSEGFCSSMLHDVERNNYVFSDDIDIIITDVAVEVAEKLNLNRDEKHCIYFLLNCIISIFSLLHLSFYY